MSPEHKSDLMPEHLPVTEAGVKSQTEKNGKDLFLCRFFAASLIIAYKKQRKKLRRQEQIPAQTTYY